MLSMALSLCRKKLQVDGGGEPSPSWAAFWEFFVASRRPGGGREGDGLGTRAEGVKTPRRRRRPRSLVVVEEKVAISPEAASVSGGGHGRELDEVGGRREVTDASAKWGSVWLARI